MTAEQEKQFQTAKLNDHRAVYTGAVMSASMRDRRNLIAIIDDLQKRQPKRYTEAELKKWLEQTNLSFSDTPWVRLTPTHHLIRPECMKYADPRDEAMWFAVYNVARFLGMIKTEGGL